MNVKITIVMIVIKTVLTCTVKVENIIVLVIQDGHWG